MMTELYIGFSLILIGFFIIFKLIFDLAKQIDDGLDDLDEKLALAIKSVMDNIPGFGNSEPVNPVQMAIAQLIGNMNRPDPTIIPPKIIERDAKGLFMSED